MVGWKHGEINNAVAKTEQLLRSESVIIFEAFFVHDGLLCLADAVIKEQGRLTLIEAKSSNNPKISQRDDFEHIQDAAFQAYVMKECGYKPDEVKLLHANGECIWPNDKDLFTTLDISQEVFLRFDEVELVSNQLLNNLNKSGCPQQKIGKFCKKPADKACPHIEACWQLPTSKTIYDLPRITAESLEKLNHENIHLIEDIPEGFDLSSSLSLIVQLIQNETEDIDRVKAKSLMDQLEYPLHFFDFETYNAAVPMWNKSRPWQQVPFQYSLHILHESGDIEHHEFLHTDSSDPRPSLINAMRQHFENEGSIVVYYAPFEKSRIKEWLKTFLRMHNSWRI